MKTQNILLGVGLGVLALYLWRRSQKRKNNPNSTSTLIVQDVIQEESNKYPSPLLEKYDIVIKPNKITKKVREKADTFTDRRYAINLSKVKEPLYL